MTTQAPIGLGGPTPPQDTPAADNPFRGRFGVVYIDDTILPGVVRSIDGCDTPEEWNVQKGTSGNFATTVWKGSKLAESIKIGIAITGGDEDTGPLGQDYDDYVALITKMRPKRGKKPPSFGIRNGVINFGSIARVGLKNPGFPKWQEGGAYWLFELELIEYNPSKTAPAGKAEPAKPPKEPTPNSQGEKELNEAMKDLK